MELPKIEQSGKFLDYFGLIGNGRDHFQPVLESTTREIAYTFNCQRGRQSESPLAAALSRRWRTAPAKASMSTRVSSQPTQASVMLWP